MAMHIYKDEWGILFDSTKCDITGSSYQFDNVVLAKEIDMEHNWARFHQALVALIEQYEVTADEKLIQGMENLVDEPISGEFSVEKRYISLEEVDLAWKGWHLTERLRHILVRNFILPSQVEVIQEEEDLVKFLKGYGVYSPSIVNFIRIWKQHKGIQQ